MENKPVGVWDHMSRPARGAWIEILVSRLTSVLSTVAPREGRVDCGLKYVIPDDDRFRLRRAPHGVRGLK